MANIDNFDTETASYLTFVTMEFQYTYIVMKSQIQWNLKSTQFFRNNSTKESNLSKCY